MLSDPCFDTKKGQSIIWDFSSFNHFRLRRTSEESETFKQVENASPGALVEGAPVKRWRLTGRYHCPVAGYRC